MTISSLLLFIFSPFYKVDHHVLPQIDHNALKSHQQQLFIPWSLFIPAQETPAHVKVLVSGGLDSGGRDTLHSEKKCLLPKLPIPIEVTTASVDLLLLFVSDKCDLHANLRPLCPMGSSSCLHLLIIINNCRSSCANRCKSHFYCCHNYRCLQLCKRWCFNCFIIIKLTWWYTLLLNFIIPVNRLDTITRSQHLIRN